MKYLISIIFIFSALASTGTWNYDQNGDDWTDTCSTGTKQSPVNIVSSSLDSTNGNDVTFIFNYDIKNYQLEQDDHYISMQFPSTDDNVKPAGYLRTKGVVSSDTERIVDWRLKNVHFHTNSEHAIDGTQYSMEMHVVHDLDPEDEPPENFDFKYLVIGVMMNTGASPSQNDFLDAMSNSLTSSTDISEVELGDFLTAQGSTLYTYAGSLTTPTCDETVLFYLYPVMDTVEASIISAFKGVVDSTYRSIQDLNGRTIYEVSATYTGTLENPPELESETKSTFSIISLISFFLIVLLWSEMIQIHSINKNKKN